MQSTSEWTGVLGVYYTGSTVGVWCRSHEQDVQVYSSCERNNDHDSLLSCVFQAPGVRHFDAGRPERKGVRLGLCSFGLRVYDSAS